MDLETGKKNKRFIKNAYPKRLRFEEEREVMPLFIKKEDLIYLYDLPPKMEEIMVEALSNTHASGVTAPLPRRGIFINYLKQAISNQLRGYTQQFSSAGLFRVNNWNAYTLNLCVPNFTLLFKSSPLVGKDQEPVKVTFTDKEIDDWMLKAKQQFLVTSKTTPELPGDEIDISLSSLTSEVKLLQSKVDEITIVNQQGNQVLFELNKIFEE